MFFLEAVSSDGPACRASKIQFARILVSIQRGHLFLTFLLSAQPSLAGALICIYLMANVVECLSTSLFAICK